MYPSTFEVLSHVHCNEIHSTDVSADSVALERKRRVVKQIPSRVPVQFALKNTAPFSRKKQKKIQLSSAILTASYFHPQNFTSPWISFLATLRNKTPQSCVLIL